MAPGPNAPAASRIPVFDDGLDSDAGAGIVRPAARGALTSVVGFLSPPDRQPGRTCRSWGAFIGLWGSPRRAPKCYNGAMTMDDLDAKISYLMGQLEGEPGDVHEIFFRLHQILETFRAEGMPVPGDLAKLEQELDRRFKDEAGD